jgi:hypothetical protein
MPLPGIEPGSPGRPVRKSDTILTELPGSVPELRPQIISNKTLKKKIMWLLHSVPLGLMFIISIFQCELFV